ncbi:MAG: hypothetical protein DRQ62_14155 [Gammaproteobacteria bacterium]|nr:MAG: hypothetical protein DRQ62_14155 [Gammaproteobacteria bacterium]
MTKPKKLVITELPSLYHEVFNQMAEFLQLTKSQFLVNLMVQSGLVEGGVENFIPDQTAKSEWADQLIERQFAWINSL